jgi:hypothetical protein
MKEKNDKSREVEPEVQKIEEWWRRLSPEEKEVIHEFGTMIQAFTSGIVANSMSDRAAADALAGSLFNGSVDFWKRVAKRWPKNTAARRELN